MIACESIRFFRLQLLVSPGGREATSAVRSLSKRKTDLKSDSLEKVCVEVCPNSFRNSYIFIFIKDKMKKNLNLI